MSLLTLFHPAPARPPGRHTAEWAALQQRARRAEQEREAMRGERDAARDETEQLRQRHALEVKGWQDALRLAGAESMAIAGELEQVKAERDAATAEVRRLNAILDADKGLPAHHVDAPIEQGCRDTPHAAEETVRDETLLDMAERGDFGLAADLLAGLRQERRPRRPPLPTDPPPPDCAATAGLPLFGHSLPVRMVRPVTPTEVSRDAANAAQASVADAMAAAP